MAARSKRAEGDSREPDSAGPATARNAALAALAAKGTVVDAPDPVVSLPRLTGVEHDLGGDVRAVVVAPSLVLRRDDRSLFLYRGEVVNATAEFVDERPGSLVRL